DRLRRLLWQGSARVRGWVAGSSPAAAQPVPAGGRHRADRSHPVAPGTAEAVPAQTPGNGPFASPVQEARARPVSRPSRSAKPGRGDSPGRGGSRRVGAARAAVRGAPRSAAPATIAARAAEAARQRTAAQVSEAPNAWHEAAEARKVAVGHRD